MVDAALDPREIGQQIDRHHDDDRGRGNCIEDRLAHAEHAAGQCRGRATVDEALKARDDVEARVELSQRGVVVLEYPEVVGQFVRERARLSDEHRDRQRHEAGKESERAEQHDHDGEPAWHAVPVQPGHGGIEADGDEQGERKQHEDLPGSDHGPGKRGCDRDSERPGQPDVERRSAIERPSRAAVLLLIGYPGLHLRGAVNLIDDVLGAQILGLADGDQGL